MKIIELSNTNLGNACRELAFKVNKPKDINVIIGIRTGGAHIAQRICSTYFEQGLHPNYYEITCRRPLTKTKKVTRLDAILPHLPRWLVNFIRRVEARFISLKLILRGEEPREVELHGDLSEFLKRLNGGRVLLVDDALDSGASMKAITERLAIINPAVKFEVAVLTVTQRNPVYRPDYSLYQQTLIRFPWSMDSRENISQ